MPMSLYNRDQMEAILIVRRFVQGLPRAQVSRLKERIRHYMRFRDDVAQFQKQYLSDICTQNCFTSQTSACCGREGIATFFADVVINVLYSSDEEVDAILQTLAEDSEDLNCVYLTEKGCLWHIKPIVCEMFLCQSAKESVLEGNNLLLSQWERLRRREKTYTWPSRPVLFDKLEEVFMREGFDSPLMYFHHSPGLLRLKAQHRVHAAPFRFLTFRLLKYID